MLASCTFRSCRRRFIYSKRGGQTSPTTPVLPDLIRRYGPRAPGSLPRPPRLHAAGHLLSLVVPGGARPFCPRSSLGLYAVVNNP